MGNNITERLITETPESLKLAVRLWARYVWHKQGEPMAHWVDYCRQHSPTLLDVPVMQLCCAVTLAVEGKR